MTVKELGEQRKALLDEANALNLTAKDEGRDLSDEESTRVDAILDLTEGIDAQLVELGKVETRTSRLQTANNRRSERMPRISAPSMPDVQWDNRGVYKPEEPWLRYAGKMTAFENTVQGREEAYRAGMFMAATMFDAPWAHKWCHNNMPEMGAIMQEGTNSTGGYLVPDPLASRIIYLRDQFGVARRECSVWPMTSDSQAIPRQVGNVTPYAVGEGDTITASDQTYDRVNLVARKWAALVRYSTELAEDAIINIADRLTTDIAIGFAEKEDDALFNGNGASTYHGINGIRNRLVDIDGAGTDSAGLVTATAGDDQWGEYIIGDLESTVGTLPEYAHQGGNAKWYTSRIGWAQTMSRLAFAQGGSTMTELVDGPRSLSFMGYPVVLSPKMPSATTAYDNSVVFIFGDLKMGTTLGDRRGFRFAVLRELYAATEEIGVVATTRFDINAHDCGDATNAGPIVGMAGNTS